MLRMEVNNHLFSQVETTSSSCQTPNKHVLDITPFCEVQSMTDWHVSPLLTGTVHVSGIPAENVGWMLHGTAHATVVVAAETSGSSALWVPSTAPVMLSNTVPHMPGAMPYSMPEARQQLRSMLGVLAVR
jgi:hypothetical protein